MAKSKNLVLETAFSIYKTEKIIGEGGAGVVYAAKDESGELVAAKVLDPAKANSEKRKRFKNEINFCLSCPHKNIVPILDHGVLKRDSNSAPFYIMPLYDSSLRAQINQGIASTSVLNYFAQIMDGVEAAHLRGSIHRDLKPENILIDQKNNTIVVADFGIARFTEEFMLTIVETSPASRLANFQYAAPEQRIRGCSIDLRADIYALGLILNEMFTKQLAIGTEYALIGPICPELAYLDDIIARMLRQNPKDRLVSTEQIKQEISVRGSEFITMQRLSKLNQTKVIPTTDIDDPLLANPPRLIGFDWDKEKLTLILNTPVNPKWVWALQNMGSYSSVLGKGPEVFHFTGAKASVSAREDQVQNIINHFKNWLPLANRVYEQRLRSEIKEAESEELNLLRAERAAEESRLRVLQNVKV